MQPSCHPASRVVTGPAVRLSARKSATEQYRVFVKHLTALVGLACLAAQLSTALHTLLVEHVRCSHRGEWLHAAYGRVAASVVKTGTSPNALSASDAVADGGHEQCTTCSERRFALPLPTFPELRARLDDCIALAVDWEYASSDSRIYSFAPKLSPPI